MSDASASGGCCALLSDRRLATMFAQALIGRFGYAVLPLSLLFTIAQSSGSFALATASSATYGFACLSMPLQSRLLDRFGQRRILPISVGLFTTFLAAVVTLALCEVGAAHVWIGLCAAGGLVPPALGPSTRAQWREATDSDLRAAAYSLDAVAEESAFFLGPVVAAGVLAIGPAWPGVVIAGLCLPVGVVGLVRSPYVPHLEIADRAGYTAGWRRWVWPFRTPRFLALLGIMLLTGAVMSATLTLLAGVASQHGRPSISALVEAAAGLAAIAGGSWWGRRRHRRSWTAQLIVLAVVRVPLLIGCVALPSLWMIAITLALSGLVTAPTFVVAFAASDAETPSAQHTEASTWVTTTTNVGGAVGTAYAGWSLSDIGVSWTFAALVVVALGSIGLAAAARRTAADEAVVRAPAGGLDS